MTLTIMKYGQTGTIVRIVNARIINKLGTKSIFRCR